MSAKLAAAATLVVEHVRELNKDPKLSVRECLGRLRLLTAHDARVMFRGNPALLKAAAAVLAASDAEIEVVSRGKTR